MSKSVAYGVIGFLRARDGGIMVTRRATANNLLGAIARARDLHEALVAEHTPEIGAATFERGGQGGAAAAAFRIFGDVLVDQRLCDAIRQTIADFEDSEPGTEERRVASAKHRDAA